MSPKPKEVSPSDSGDLESVVFKCLTEFFSQTIVECGCAASISSVQKEIDTCKSLIGAQTDLIQQLQSEVNTLKFEILKIRSNPTKTFNSTANVEIRKSVWQLQSNVQKNNESNQPMIMQGDVFKCRPADFQNENKHFQNRSNLSRFTKLYLNSEIPTEIKLIDSPNLWDDEGDKPPKVIKINADEHHQPPLADDEGFKEIVQKKKPKSKKNLKNTSSYVIGVGPSEQLNTLKVAPKKAFLYVSRLAPGTTINTLNITPLSR